MDGRWLSILEFANYKGKSVSTIRRYIKAERVKFKEENGKYFIWARDYKDPSLQNEKACEFDVKPVPMAPGTPSPFCNVSDTLNYYAQGGVLPTG